MEFNNKEIKAKSLSKALNILECFSVARPELGITEISNMLGMNKSHVHNIISTLEQRGYVIKCPNGKYKPWLKLLEYSFMINQHLGYPHAIYDIILETADRMQCLLYFGLPWGTDVLYLYVVHPRSMINEMPYRSITGEKAPLYCTGIGKAILAAFPEEEWDQRITKDRKPFTDKTILDYNSIIEELKITRSRGYSIDNGERDPGVRCVGVPVYNKRNELVGGISLSGPEKVMTDLKIERGAEALISASHKIKERLYR